MASCDRGGRRRGRDHRRSSCLFTSDEAAANAFLLTLGVVLVLIAWLGPRVELEYFELLGAKIRVRELVTRRLQLAETQTRD